MSKPERFCTNVDDFISQRLCEFAQLAQRRLELVIAHAGELYSRHDGILRFLFKFSLISKLQILSGELR